MKDIIIHVVSTNNGIKDHQLAMKVLEIVNPVRFQTELYHAYIEDLVRTGQLKQLEFSENNNSRITSLYFSKGTSFLALRGFADGIERSVVAESNTNKINMAGKSD